MAKPVLSAQFLQHVAAVQCAEVVNMASSVDSLDNSKFAVKAASDSWRNNLEPASDSKP